MRWFKTAGGLLAIMLLMASCIRVDGAIKIEDDGSGTVNFLSALNTESLTSVLGDFDIPEEELGDTAELCDGFSSDFNDTDGLPAGAVITPYDQDGFCGSRVEYSLSPSLDQSTNIQEVLDPTARLYKEGDNWFFETDFDTDDITSEASDAPAAMVAALFADASFRLTLDLPGRAVEGQNNATEVGSDGKFTWNIDILNPPTRLFAQTKPGSGGGSGGGGGLNPIIIGVVVAALCAGLAFFFINKRKADAGAASLDSISPAGLLDVDTPPAGMPGAVPSQATMPVDDGPAITATPPMTANPIVGAHAAPISDAKETVVMNAADVQKSLQDAAADATATAAAAPQPVFDEALNAWVVDDPARGRLRHDPATDTWNPV